MNQPGMLLASGSSDPTVHIYHLADEIRHDRLEGHSDRVYAVDWHPLDAVVSSCSADMTIRVWAYRNRR
jgi:COMPASS component SWD3